MDVEVNESFKTVKMEIPWRILYQKKVKWDGNWNLYSRIDKKDDGNLGEKKVS